MPTPAAEIQIGTAVIFGIGGSITMTGAATFNMETMDLEDTFKKDMLPSQDGAVISTVVASQRIRRGTFKFVPTGATRVAAEAIVTSLFALGPLAVITIGSATVTIFNDTFNYTGGAKVALTREGWAVCDIGVEQYEDAANVGSFKHLAIVI